MGSMKEKGAVSARLRETGLLFVVDTKRLDRE